MMRETMWKHPNRDESSVNMGKTPSKPAKQPDKLTDTEEVANMAFSDFLFFLEEMERG